jgi:hypothetical protein
MSLIDSTLQLLDDALRARRLDVQTVGHTLNVSHGRGPMAHKANIDPQSLIERLEASAPHAHRRLVNGFASGIQHVLLEPVRSRASEWTFVESAKGLVPNLEVDTFVDGVRAASGQDPWVLPFVDDLVVSHLVELDQGVRVLTGPQVERWGVTADRVKSAARSILFHKSREVKPKPFDGFDLVSAITVGDDYEAVRALVIADAFYTEIGSGYRFSIPRQDLFLSVSSDSPEHLEALDAATRSVFETADYPLSRRLFRFELGRPVPLVENGP